MRITGKRYKHLLYEDEELQLLPKKSLQGKKYSADLKGPAKSSHKKMQKKLKDRAGARKGTRAGNRSQSPKKEAEFSILPEIYLNQQSMETPFTPSFNSDWLPKLQGSVMGSEIGQSASMDLALREAEQQSGLTIEIPESPGMSQALSGFNSSPRIEPSSPPSVQLMSPLSLYEGAERFCGSPKAGVKDIDASSVSLL